MDVCGFYTSLATSSTKRSPVRENMEFVDSSKSPVKPPERPRHKKICSFRSYHQNTGTIQELG